MSTWNKYVWFCLALTIGAAGTTKFNSAVGTALLMGVVIIHYLARIAYAVEARLHMSSSKRASNSS